LAKRTKTKKPGPAHRASVRVRHPMMPPLQAPICVTEANLKAEELISFGGAYLKKEAWPGAEACRAECAVAR
jgi:hypothetical protein